MNNYLNNQLTIRTLNRINQKLNSYLILSRKRFNSCYFTSFGIFTSSWSNMDLGWIFQLLKPTKLQNSEKMKNYLFSLKNYLNNNLCYILKLNIKYWMWVTNSDSYFKHYIMNQRDIKLKYNFRWFICNHLLILTQSFF